MTTPDRVTNHVIVPVRLRPWLAAMISTMAADQGIPDHQLIADVLDDLAKRGATAYGKRHILVIHRAPARETGRQAAPEPGDFTREPFEETP